MAIDASDTEKVTSPPQKVVPKAKSKWEGEDEDDENPVVCISSMLWHLDSTPVCIQSDWEASSDEEEILAPVAPPKKKGTLKAKLAEKEAEKATRQAAGDVEYDSDEVLDSQEKAKRDKERELAADLHNATELFGAAAIGGACAVQ